MKHQGQTTSETMSMLMRFAILIFLVMRDEPENRYSYYPKPRASRCSSTGIRNVSIRQPASKCIAPLVHDLFKGGASPLPNHDLAVYTINLVQMYQVSDTTEVANSPKIAA